MQFPCFMYHAEHGARLFSAQAEFDESGDGWVDSPAKIEAKKEQAELVETPKRGPGRPKKVE